MTWDTPPRQTNRLRAAELVTMATTVIAFALTVVAVQTTPAVEANPVTRALIDTLGWTAAGCLAVATVTAVFAVYRRVQNLAPRVVLAGSGLLVAVGVADVLVSLPVALRFDLARGVGVGEVAPIAVTAVLACVLVARPRRADRWATETAPSPSRGQARKTAVCGLLLAVVLSGALAAVTFGSEDTGVSPVGDAAAQETGLIEDFEDGDTNIEAANWDGWSSSGGAGVTANSSGVLSGTYSGVYSADGGAITAQYSGTGDGASPDMISVQTQIIDPSSSVDAYQTFEIGDTCSLR